MQDFLVRVASVAIAKAAMPQWVNADGSWKNPQWCDILPVVAYTDVGTPPVLDNSVFPPTVVTPGVAPTPASGAWFLVSVDRAVTVPAAAQPAIKAQTADRSGAMQLPAGIKGLSTMWAGMLSPIPG